MAGYVLRRSVPADAVRLNDLYRQLLAALYGAENVSEEDTCNLDGRWDDEACFTCVAEADGYVVGCLSMEIHRIETGAYLFLTELCVDEKHRCQGMGTALLRHAEDYARAKGLDAIVLSAELRGVRARALYARLGFEPAPQYEGDDRMVKRLPR